VFFGEQQAPQRIPKTTSFDITFLRHQQGSKAYDVFAALDRAQQKQWIQERLTEAGRSITESETRRTQWSIVSAILLAIFQ
jgi:hypothetical protein